MMAQREATQIEAKCKVAEREVNKETRRKEKEELAEQVQIQKEERATKKFQKTQAEVERRARCSGRRVGVGAGAGQDPTVTRGHGAGVAALPTGAAAIGGGGAAPDGGAYSPHSAGASPPYTALQNEMPTNRPLSPPRIFTHHPFSQAMVSTAWVPQFHGSPNSPFLFNPIMAMQHMLPHPTGFTHNGNPTWLPQVDRTVGSDVRPIAEFTGGRFLAPDRASIAPERHGMTTWQGSSWAP